MNSWGLHAQRCTVLDYRNWDKENSLDSGMVSSSLDLGKDSSLDWDTGSLREDIVALGGKRGPRKGRVSHRPGRDIPGRRLGEDTTDRRIGEEAPGLRVAEACTWGGRNCSPLVGDKGRLCLVVAGMEHSNPNKNR